MKKLLVLIVLAVASLATADIYPPRAYPILNDSSALMQQTTPLTATQVMNLRATAVTLTPTPASNQWIQPLLVIIRKPTTASGWTIPSSTVTRLYWGSSIASVAAAWSVNTATWGSGACFDDAPECIVMAQGIAGTESLYVAQKEVKVDFGTPFDASGQPITFKNTHATTEISAVVNDAAGYALYITLYYRVITVR